MSLNVFVTHLTSKVRVFFSFCSKVGEGYNLEQASKCHFNTATIRVVSKK